ncbi:GNAT family N-acetyltransferase [Aureimonas flava]|nr:GNAT family N-acetyltransferase [Aureimonas flava]
MRLQSFELATRDIADADLDALHALSISVGWPHRRADWDLLRSLGRGFASLDDIGRVFGSAMWFRHGADCATIGMVITSPRVQTQGGGRWMMDRILAECGGRRVIVNATRAAHALYLPLGFEPRATVHQIQGFVGAVPQPDGRGTGTVEPVPSGDLAAILALDGAAFGADRTAVLARLAPLSRVLGIRRDGRWDGYAMRRPFGRGHVVGPVVAASEDDAVRLVAPLLADLAGRFARMDTRQPEGPLRALLRRSGLGVFDTVRTLTRGGALPEVRTGRPGVYGLAAQPLS